MCLIFVFLCLNRHTYKRYGWELFAVQRWASNSQYWQSYDHERNPKKSTKLPLFLSLKQLIETWVNSSALIKWSSDLSLSLSLSACGTWIKAWECCIPSWESVVLFLHYHRIPTWGSNSLTSNQVLCAGRVVECVSSSNLLSPSFSTIGM